MSNHSIASTIANALKSRVVGEVFRFGLVGIFAAAVHFAIVVYIVQTFQLHPLSANVLGFLISFQVSYWGHRQWTFATSDELNVVALPKLFALQVINLVSNEFLFFIFLSFNLPYQFALIIVLAILPLFTFTISKLWIFKV